MRYFVPFSRPVLSSESIDEVVAVAMSGWLTTGPRVQAFEAALSSYFRSQEALALNSCTAALHLALRVSGVGAGDEVIVPSLTYCATANVVVHCGATPIVADVRSDSCSIDIDSVVAKITPKTKALIAVHFAGYPAPVEQLRAVSDRHGLVLIEDCAHAIETEINGKHAGTFGDFGCFSFYATKNVTTGEGGAMISRSREFLAEARMLSLHGVSKAAWSRTAESMYRHYDVLAAGYKYNMMDLQAALGIHQLTAVEENWRRRETIWRQYKAKLIDLPIEFPSDAPECTRHGLHLFAVRVGAEAIAQGITRDAVLQSLTEQGIGTGVHYHALTEFTYFQQTWGWHPDDTPVATDIGRRTFSLPLNPYLTEEAVEAVCDAVRTAFASVS